MPTLGMKLCLLVLNIPSIVFRSKGPGAVPLIRDIRDSGDLRRYFRRVRPLHFRNGTREIHRTGNAVQPVGGRSLIFVTQAEVQRDSLIQFEVVMDEGAVAVDSQLMR